MGAVGEVGRVAADGHLSEWGSPLGGVEEEPCGVVVDTAFATLPDGHAAEGADEPVSLLIALPHIDAHDAHGRGSGEGNRRCLQRGEGEETVGGMEDPVAYFFIVAEGSEFVMPRTLAGEGLGVGEHERDHEGRAQAPAREDDEEGEEDGGAPYLVVPAHEAGMAPCPAYHP